MRRGLLIAVLTVGCEGSSWYDTQVQIMSMTPVQRAADGTVLDLDVHLEYPACPGHQLEVIRGDTAFAACMQRYKAGDQVDAHIEHYRTERNARDWDVHRLGECDRAPDPDDEAAFDTVEECEETVVNGVVEGFLCNHVPHAALLQACPWFARH